MFKGHLEIVKSLLNKLNDICISHHKINYRFNLILWVVRKLKHK